jgi:predicted dehydrogenase
MLAAKIAPAFVPARLLRAGQAPSNRITLGVIGVGAQGLYDMRNFLGYDDVRVTAICDVNRRNIETARGVIAEAYGSRDVKVFSDFRELNADRSIDAVLMALPVHWHSIAAQDVILQGKHIYHEKPMALSFEEARRVRAAVHKTGVVFQFGTQQRSDLYFRWACELALNRRLGKVKEIQVSVPGGKEGPPFPEQPVPAYVDWDRWVGPAPMTAFHEDKLQRDNHENITNFSLGMISCWGIHHLDIAQWGNGADRTGPQFVEGEGAFPREGAFDAILRWKVSRQPRSHAQLRGRDPQRHAGDLRHRHRRAVGHTLSDRADRRQTSPPAGVGPAGRAVRRRQSGQRYAVQQGLPRRLETEGSLRNQGPRLSANTVSSLALGPPSDCA